jgi:hypothetical protein
MELPKTSNVRSRMAEIMQPLKTWSASRAQSYRSHSHATQREHGSNAYSLLLIQIQRRYNWNWQRND